MHSRVYRWPIWATALRPGRV